MIRTTSTFRPLVLGLALVGAIATCGVDIDAAPAQSPELSVRLKSSDFRVRVQAALLLGKTSDRGALDALIQSLRDESAAVRAASAAALGTLGDPAALAALHARENDDNAAVRRQVSTTIAKLERTQKEQVAERKKARLLVKLDGMKNRVKGGAPEAVGAAAQASRDVLRRIPGVALLHPSEDPEAAGKAHDRPVLVVQGSIKDLSAENSGKEYVATANVEFVMQSLPEYAIVGKLSGHASVTGDAAADGLARSRVQDAAVGAAVDSALARSKDALLRAAQGS